MSTIYCMNCGAELDGNARFCSECGSPTLLGAGLVESEAVRQISCPSCGALNDPAEKFCTSCGGALTQAPASMLDPLYDSYSQREASAPVREGVRTRTLVFGAVAAVAVVGVVLIGAFASGLLGGRNDLGSITEVATTGLGGAGNAQSDSETQDLTSAGIDVKDSLASYSWDELSIIAREMSRKASRDEALAIAREYHLVDEAGNMSPDTKEVKVGDMGVVNMRLIDVYHDDLANGEGKAGLTFLASNLFATHAINADVDDITGGWESSQMRGWLNVDVYNSLTDDVRTAIVDVDKHTDNVGHSTDASCVTSTVDKIWLPSMVELIGPIDWTWPSDPGNSAGYNAITNAEGSQYALFQAQGIQALAGNAPLALAGADGGMSWWERTPSPSGTGRFRVVTVDGDPTEIAGTSAEHGVCIGFCL